MVGEVSLQEGGNSEEVSSTAERRVNACEEIVSMGSDNSCEIYQQVIPSVQHHAQEKYYVWQEFHRNVDAPEPRLRSSVRLGEGVGESHEQG